MIDVLIVGAGPNGLLLAAELALAGVRPVVCERLAAPTTEQRANGLVGQVVVLTEAALKSQSNCHHDRSPNADTFAA